MIDAVDRMIVERAAMDRGFPRGLTVSLVGHLLIAGVVVGAPLLLPHKPIIRTVDGFAEVIRLPRGGGGSPDAGPPAAPKSQPAPPPAAPKSKIIKPPKDEPRKGLPLPDAKKSRRASATPEAAPAAGSRWTGQGSGNSMQTPGIGIGLPPGDGVPNGTGDDWYMGGVARKVWMNWARQIHTGMTQPIIVRFTILADGSVANVEVTQPCGVYLLDSAAQSAILSAAPFSRLPSYYGTDRKTVEAFFKPTS